MGWKDTILVPTGSTIDILVIADNPGAWHMHCHIAEHLGAGLETAVKVA
jgi:FtsP/CotA-like multicopper oxidase with cupredoxin domain